MSVLSGQCPNESRLSTPSCPKCRRCGTCDRSCLDRSAVLAGGLFRLVHLGARRLAGQELLGLLDPFLPLGAAAKRQLLVPLCKVRVAPAGDVVPALDARGAQLLLDRRAY